MRLRANQNAECPRWTAGSPVSGLTEKEPPARRKRQPLKPGSAPCPHRGLLGQEAALHPAAHTSTPSRTLRQQTRGSQAESNKKGEQEGSRKLENWARAPPPPPPPPTPRHRELPRRPARGVNEGVCAEACEYGWGYGYVPEALWKHR